MANHFTPDELAQEFGMETKQIVQLCIEESVPIYKGKVDRSLLTLVMKSRGISIVSREAATV